MPKVCAVLMAGLLMQAAQAGEVCGAGVAAAVAKSARIDDADKVVSAACKPWPRDRHTLLAAYAFGSDASEDKVLVVAMVDAATGRVVSSYRTEAGEDAAVHFGENSLSIDTAPYQLTSDVRAFGVRFASDARGASCPDGIWSDELTLFVADGKALRPVLRGMPMSRSETRKGSFCGPAADIAYEEARLSVGLAATASGGYADLLVSARVIRHDGEREGSASTERHTLRYDGSEYRAGKPAPWWLLFFPLGQ